MIAKAVEETVGVGSDAGGGQGNQGTERRRLAFEGKLIEETAVDVGVEGGGRFPRGRCR